MIIRIISSPGKKDGHPAVIREIRQLTNGEIVLLVYGGRNYPKATRAMFKDIPLSRVGQIIKRKE